MAWYKLFNVISCVALLALVRAQSGQFSAPIIAGKLDDVELDEASGCAASRIFPDILYIHNDHGDRPRIFAVNATNAQVVAILEISPAKHNDWEDIAVGPCSQGSTQSCIYILDDGVIHGKEARTIYRVVEPDTIQDQTLAPDSVLHFNWTEHESETLMVDPMANVYLISFVEGSRGMIVSVPPQFWGQPTAVFIDSGAYFAMASEHHGPLGGDISPDGHEVLVENSGAVYWWAPTDDDYPAALVHPGHKVLTYHVERNGQAVCWAADGQSFYTVAEARHATLYQYEKTPDVSIIG